MPASLFALQQFDDAFPGRAVYNARRATCGGVRDSNEYSTADLFFDNLSAYEPAGNTVRDPQGRRFTYDGENKQVMVETLDANGNPVSTVGEYVYDGDGKRVKKHVPSTGEVTVFVYDAGGKLIGEYSTVAAPQSPKVSYTTADHLGSPRILTDENGATISRRDFMSYGEEIARSAYGSDNVRKTFTTYERDNEIDLDFAEARFYNFNHGRFTSVDPLLSTGEPDYPQTWNRYAYALNSPLYYTDPTGMYVCKGNKEQCEQFAARLAEAKENLKKIEEKYGGKDSKQYKKAAASVNSYGEDETGKKTNNGVFITFNRTKSGADTTGTFANRGRGKLQKIVVDFNPNELDSETSQGLVAHEGNHVDYFQTVGNIKSRYDFEFRAHEVQSLFYEAQYPNDPIQLEYGGTKYDFWNPSWEGPDKETLRTKALNDMLAVPKKLGGYGLTPPPPPRPKSSPRRRKKG